MTWTDSTTNDTAWTQPRQQIITLIDNDYNINDPNFNINGQLIANWDTSSDNDTAWF